MKESKVNRKDKAIGETEVVQGGPTGSTNLVIKRLRNDENDEAELFSFFFAKQ